MDRADTRPRKPVLWIGGAKKAIRSHPADVRQTLGRQLLNVQCGVHPPGARPFGEGLPSGILKLVHDDAGETFRAAYVIAFESVVYVLDVFQKKSKRSAESPRRDLERIRKRYIAAKADYYANDAAYVTAATK